MSAPERPRRSLRSPAELAAAGLIDPAAAASLAGVAARYAVAISADIAALIDPDRPDDPIARQFLPSTAELETAPEERADPIGDGAHAPVKGIVHRYPDRVLLKPIHVCPVYCRFCFRREMVGDDGDCLNPAELEAALAYIRGQPRIWEVILSGGDPLMLPPAKLRAIMAALAGIEHVGVVRIHTRMPIAAPRRVTPALLAALESDKAVFMVLHCNHARELADAQRAACRAVIGAGIPLLAQTVLLKGVNDDPAALEELMRTLVRNRIKPYYLHHGDLAPGTGHFRTTIAAGQALMRRLRGHASGLCQPSYVLDIPGGHGKVPIGPGYHDAATGTVEDWQGCRHRYPPQRSEE